MLLMGAILLCLYLPLLQSSFGIKKYIRELKGAFIPTESISITKENWFNSEFQNKKEAYLNQNFGFRNYYVMLNNQVDYSLFNKANVDKVVVGKGGFLYESNYITSYYGEDVIEESAVDERIKKLKDLQDLLYTQGITLEVVFAPSKATFYPEFIPDSWKSESKKNNYTLVKEICEKAELNFVDFNDWFLKLKNITPYDLYPKTGIHWSNYGSLLAFDSLTKKIEYDSKLNLKNLFIQNIFFSDSLRGPDNDIGSAMNLIWKIQPLPMPYANYKWTEDSTFVKPQALFIGDSYFWNIYYEGLTNNVFENCKFWYYNTTVYPESESQREVSQLNIVDEIKKQKVIVLMATECNLKDLGWGFVENAHKALKSEMNNIIRKKAYLQDLIEEIYKTPNWLHEVERKAKEKNISVEDMTKLDATYIYETDYNRPEVVELTEENKKRIFNSPEWIEQIKQKAQEKNISFEEMLELDAKYIYVTEQRAELEKK